MKGKEKVTAKKITSRKAHWGRGQLVKKSKIVWRKKTTYTPSLSSNYGTKMPATSHGRIFLRRKIRIPERKIPAIPTYRPFFQRLKNQSTVCSPFKTILACNVPPVHETVDQTMVKATSIAKMFPAFKNEHKICNF